MEEIDRLESGNFNFVLYSLGDRDNWLWSGKGSDQDTCRNILEVRNRFWPDRNFARFEIWSAQDRYRLMLKPENHKSFFGLSMTGPNGNIVCLDSDFLIDIGRVLARNGLRVSRKRDD